MTTWRMVSVYGLPGEPAPIPKVPLFIGGVASGRLEAVPLDQPSVTLPAKRRPYFYAEPDALPQAYNTELYEWRTYQPCWSAAPVKLLVHQDLGTDEAALAITQEFYPDALYA